MIGLPRSVKILVFTEATDMRNYAESSVMRSGAHLGPMAVEIFLNAAARLLAGSA